VVKFNKTLSNKKEMCTLKLTSSIINPYAFAKFHRQWKEVV